METRGQRALRITFYSVWAVLMTALTYVLGAAPLKVLRVRLGRLGYWAFGLTISSGFFMAGSKMMALAFFSLVLLMGVFDELEETGTKLLVSGFFTVLINSLLGAGVFALWVSRIGPKWAQQIESFIETLVKPAMDMNSYLQLNVHELMLELPSIIIMMWMAAIYLAVLLETRLSGGVEAKHPAGTPSMRHQLAEIRMPDSVIWTFIVALLLGYGTFSVAAVHVVGANLVNICMLLFFFQGIAVVAKFFETMRMGMFWQILFMVLLIVQLFPFVALLGLMDYWLDFRHRLSKRSEQFNSET